MTEELSGYQLAIILFRTGKDDKEGFTIRHTPAHEYRVCHGCKWLKTETVLRGHKRVTNDYSCTHPDAQLSIDILRDWRWIHLNHEGDCITPDWCPYLKNDKSKRVKSVCKYCGGEGWIYAKNGNVRKCKHC